MPFILSLSPRILTEGGGPLSSPTLIMEDVVSVQRNWLEDGKEESTHRFVKDAMAQFRSELHLW